MKYLVYDIAATESGALTVLENYYSRAVLDDTNEYVFIVSVPSFPSARGVSIRRFPQAKNSWLHRLWFDYFIAPKIVKEEKPDRIISLQNMRIPLVRVPQTVLEQNCIFKPFTDYRFSFAKDPVLWVRQNILGELTIRSLKKADALVVQSEWMKRKCIDNLGFEEEDVEVALPILPEGDYPKYKRGEVARFIYPATAMRYKNHKLVLDACDRLKKQGVTGYEVLFTFGKEEGKVARGLHQTVESLGLPVKFIGWQSRDSLFSLYESSILLVASQLESYCLPLYEGKASGVPIVAPDADYSMEALSNYSLAFLFRQNDAESLAHAMESAIRDR